MELTNNEIAKVFAMYWDAPYEADDFIRGKKCIVNKPSGHTLENILKNGIEDRRLPITPLSKISDEDAIDVGKMCGAYNYFEGVTEWTLINGREVSKNICYGSGGFGIQYVFIYQYLISKGYAVPLFFGVGHWANGKTAIELNIAIDKTIQ